MRDFGETRWSPDGSRPHVDVLVTPEVAALAAAYLDHARVWWGQQADPRQFEQVFRPVIPDYLHLTLTWLDRVTAKVGTGLMNDIEVALRTRLSDLPPFEITAGPGTVGYYALELFVTPSDAADALARAARQALRDAVGPDAVPEPPTDRPWCPHVAILHGRQRVDTDGLASRILYVPPPAATALLRPTTMRIDGVVLVDQDTWGPNGLAWDQQTARCIPLGAA